MLHFMVWIVHYQYITLFDSTFCELLIVHCTCDIVHVFYMLLIVHCMLFVHNTV